MIRKLLLTAEYLGYSSRKLAKICEQLCIVLSVYKSGPAFQRCTLASGEKRVKGRFCKCLTQSITIRSYLLIFLNWSKMRLLAGSYNCLISDTDVSRLKAATQLFPSVFSLCWPEVCWKIRLSLPVHLDQLSQQRLSQLTSSLPWFCRMPRSWHLSNQKLNHRNSPSHSRENASGKNSRNQIHCTSILYHEIQRCTVVATVFILMSSDINVAKLSTADDFMTWQNRRVLNLWSKHGWNDSFKLFP